MFVLIIISINKDDHYSFGAWPFFYLCVVSCFAAVYTFCLTHPECYVFNVLFEGPGKSCLATKVSQRGRARKTVEAVTGFEATTSPTATTCDTRTTRSRYSILFLFHLFVDGRRKTEIFAQQYVETNIK